MSDAPLHWMQRRTVMDKTKKNTSLLPVLWILKRQAFASSRTL
jgi:hypothetical protein